MKNFDFGQNFRKISILVKFSKKIRFWSKFSKILKNSDFTQIIENLDLGQIFEKFRFW